MSSRIIRMTISIPQVLKGQMDAIKDQANWSAVAARAFRTEVEEIQSRGRMPTAKIVERLRAFQKNDEYRDGKDAGRTWAAHRATLKELRSLGAFNPKNNDPLKSSTLVFMIRPDEEKTEATAAAFWNQALGTAVDRIINPWFMRGFFAGAVEVWKEVQPEL